MASIEKVSPSWLRYECTDDVRSEEVTRKVSEKLPDETLCERVDELIRSKPLLYTTGSRAFIEELAARSERLEEAIREIAREVQKVGASQKGMSDRKSRSGRQERFVNGGSPE